MPCRARIVRSQGQDLTKSDARGLCAFPGWGKDEKEEIVFRIVGRELSISPSSTVEKAYFT